MNYADIHPVDTANGPGVRVSIFVSGCNHHCKGCFNKEAWDFNYGKMFTDGVIDHIIDLMRPKYITGITVLGGEPFDPSNQPHVLRLLKKIKEVYGDTKTIWVFTGYIFDKDIVTYRLGNPDITREYINLVDVLVDGPFIEERKDISLRFRGSDNQRIIDVKKSLETNSIVLWNDWQNKYGMKPRK